MNIANGKLMSIADLGGREILGMSGSLVDYINTGVATTDSFQKNVPAAPLPVKKESFGDKLLKALGILALGVGAIFGVYKGRHKISSGIKKIPEFSHKLADFVESKIPSFSDIKNFFGKIFKKKS